MSDALLGALVGGGIAVVAQVTAQTVSHVLARDRERKGRIRATTATVFGHGSAIRNLVKSRPMTQSTGAKIDAMITEFNTARYELALIAPTGVRRALNEYANAMELLVEEWSKPPDLMSPLHQDRKRYLAYLAKQMADWADLLDRTVRITTDAPEIAKPTLSAPKGGPIVPLARRLNPLRFWRRRRAKARIRRPQS